MESNEELFNIASLSLEGDFEMQVQQLMKYIRLSKEEVEDLQILIDDLQYTLRNIWQGCTVNAFGSIVFGLGIKTSDIDIYVELPKWMHPPRVAFVKQARNHLSKIYNIYQNVTAILTAKVPIVKFFHVPTRRNCDVNFSSPAGVHNSELLGFLLQNQTILVLNVILKFWSKVHKLTGTNLMSSYALTLLVIFYLQQKSILPSIISLQADVPERVFCDWNMAFDRPDLPANDEYSLFQLLSGFFNYYRKFDFEKFIICPYLGQTIEKNVFADLNTVPDEFAKYKDLVTSNKCKPLRIDSLMCIQDPFEHNRNCSLPVYPKLANAIVTHFDIGAQCIKNGENNYLKNILTTIATAPCSKGRKKKVPRSSVKPINGLSKRKNYKKLKQLTKNIKNHINKQ